MAVLEEPEPGPGPGSQLLGTRAEEAILFNPPWVLSPHTYRGLTLPGWVQTVSVGRVSDATYSLRPLPPHPSLCFCPSRGPKSRPKIKAHRYYQMLMWPEDLQSLKASLESPEADQFLWFFCPKVSPESSRILPPNPKGLSSPTQAPLLQQLSTQTVPTAHVPKPLSNRSSRQATPCLRVWENLVLAERREEVNSS